MSQNLQSVLDAARQLPPSERRRLIEQLMEETDAAKNSSQAHAEALRIVDELFGSMSGLDRETVKWIAEDEELCGY